MAKADPRATPPPKPNVALIRAMEAKGLSPRRLARKIGVVERTVNRWREDQDIEVHEDTGRRAADALDCTPPDLWPHRFPAPERGNPPPARQVSAFNPVVYASRTQVPVDVWQQHFADATVRIDILVFAATFLFDTIDGFTNLLVSAAARGVDVRLVIGDPDAPNMTLRGEEEGIGTAVQARCRTTVELLTPYAATAGLQIRTHQTTLYSSIFRVDDEAIVNFHIYGSPGRSNPVMIFARDDEPRLWATLEQAFTDVWGGAAPLADPTEPAP